jgi:hypothetical protein
MMPKRLLAAAFLAGGLAVLAGCQSGGADAPNPDYNRASTPASELSARPLIDWMELLYYHIANEKINPPHASRIYGYTGVLMYEAVLPGMPDRKSMVGQLNGLEELPRPDPALEYDWLSVLDEAVYQGINYHLERNITGEVRTLNNMLNAQLDARRAAGVSEEVIERSRAYGKELAFAIEDWAKQDNFDGTRLRTAASTKAISREGRPELWEATDFGQVPMEPYWPTLRPFVLTEAKECGIDYPHGLTPSEGPVKSTLPEFSTDPASEFYQATKAVYDKDQNLTEEERIIALFWADDPGETSTPPGHWIYIMNNMIKSQEMDLGAATEMFGLTCPAIADAFITVWYTKYQVYLVRPKTYIREFMGDPGWEPYVETPPFPEYASGHSGVSGAAATMLTELLGDQPFIDSTHVIIGLEPRSFENFWAAAREAAESRHYGGIHYRAAIEDALEQGKCVAEKTMERVQTRYE